MGALQKQLQQHQAWQSSQDPYWASQGLTSGGNTGLGQMNSPNYTMTATASSAAYMSAADIKAGR